MALSAIFFAAFNVPKAFEAAGWSATLFFKLSFASFNFFPAAELLNLSFKLSFASFNFLPADVLLNLSFKLSNFSLLLSFSLLAFEFDFSLLFSIDSSVLSSLEFPTSVFFGLGPLAKLLSLFDRVSSDGRGVFLGT